eukprot:CAMPEP_0170544206 /NCGR_PEP_ID=MMETSP0211-20121228/3061_1 /TAXON_ID=311385 /ORGANISM="Pseudokeronopsis sp., Strain OXSARD2" /LENGTH=74 /DNA_ID=CAMNT_0010847811 /DNA_START=203 /DNA_END=427 /DNA_ORIENTATION=-
MSELRRRSLKKKKLRLGYHKYFDNPRKSQYGSPMNPESKHMMKVSPPTSPNFELRGHDFHPKGGRDFFIGEEDK